MTIKKLGKTSAPEAAAEAAEAPAAMPAPETATIADRFKLDTTAPAPKKTGGGKSAMAAAIVGVVALGVAGFLTFLIYQHWQYLMAA